MNKFSNRGISTLIVIIIVAVVVILGGGILAWQSGWIPKSITQKQVACTMEAKVCPDGSAVGRTGPNCEFVACPNINESEIANWETYTNQIHKFEIKYPKDWTLQKEVGVPPATIIGNRWEDNGYCSMSLLIVENGFSSTAEMDWYRQNGYKEETYTIAGMTGTKFSKFSVSGNGPVGVIYFNNNSDRIDLVASADEYQSCISIFNQMLPTFKFTK